MKEIYCGDCGKRLSEGNKVCPKCGSKRKHYKMKFEEKINLHHQTSGKVKKKGLEKPIQEFKAGNHLYKKTGKWYHRKMNIDRGKDYYEEVVTDKATGKIVHQCKEPLSKHKGHGSAKHRRKPKN